jgi:hypothetical protein
MSSRPRKRPRNNVIFSSAVDGPPVILVESSGAGLECRAVRSLANAGMPFRGDANSLREVVRTPPEQIAIDLEGVPDPARDR